MSFPSEKLAPELVPERSKVVLDVEPSPIHEVGDLEFISVFKKGETRLKGWVIRELAQEAEALLGLFEAKRMLELKEQIPKDLENRMILFLGTVIKKRTHRQEFPFLWNVSGVWELQWGSIDLSWADDACLVPRLRLRDAPVLGEEDAVEMTES